MKLTKFMAVLVGAAAMVGCAASEANNEACSKEQAVVETIMTRRSVRNYTTEAVDREQMAKILECGIYAPSAMNMQPWAVRVVDAPDFIEGVTNIAVEQNPQLKEQEGFRNFFRNAPTVAFIAAP
jgi:nitroreductase